MQKIKLGVIFGGMSTEHDVSIVSGTSVIKNLNKEKYDVYPIYISKEGIWNKYLKNVNEIDVLEIGSSPKETEKIEDVLETLKSFDVIFPVLHGKYGEDGSIQGLFELINVPYVGCNILSSSVGMDKAYTKVIFEKAKILQAKYVYIRKYNDKYIYIDEEFNEEILELDAVSKKIEQKITYPMFIKPSNSGSSVGINKAKNNEELKKYIEYAGKFDNKILVEENINGREVECAVLGNEEVIASCVGEVLSAEDFYTFDAKYKNVKSLTQIPANIEKGKEDEIKKLAIKAFKAIDGKGLSRVDFFIEKDSDKIYINEINTMPGFTGISMYPKLFENEGISYGELLDRLINLAM